MIDDDEDQVDPDEMAPQETDGTPVEDESVAVEDGEPSSSESDDESDASLTDGDEAHPEHSDPSKWDPNDPSSWHPTVKKRWKDSYAYATRMTQQNKELQRKIEELEQKVGKADLPAHDPGSPSFSDFQRKKVAFEAVREAFNAATDPDVRAKLAEQAERQFTPADVAAFKAYDENRPAYEARQVEQRVTQQVDQRLAMLQQEQERQRHLAFFSQPDVAKFVEDEVNYAAVMGFLQLGNTPEDAVRKARERMGTIDKKKASLQEKERITRGEAAVDRDRKPAKKVMTSEQIGQEWEKAVLRERQRTGRDLHFERKRELLDELLEKYNTTE